MLTKNICLDCCTLDCFQIFLFVDCPEGNQHAGTLQGIAPRASATMKIKVTSER